MNITQRFKEILFKVNKNKSELAKDLNVTPTAISKSIKGNSLPSSKLLIPLGEKLGISIDWLLFGKGEMFMSDMSDAQKNIYGDGVQVNFGNDSNNTNSNNINKNKDNYNKVKSLKKEIEILAQQLKEQKTSHQEVLQMQKESYKEQKESCKEQLKSKDKIIELLENSLKNS